MHASPCSLGIDACLHTSNTADPRTRTHDTQPFRLWMHEAAVGGVAIAEMLFCTSLLALVGAGTWTGVCAARLMLCMHECIGMYIPSFQSFFHHNSPVTVTPTTTFTTQNTKTRSSGDQAGSSPRCLRVWNTKRRSSLYDLGFVSKILAVKMNR